MKKLEKATFGVLISIVVIVLLASASTAVPYVESNSHVENLETHQREQFKDKIRSLLSTIENKDPMINENPGNMTLLQLLRILIAYLLVIPVAILLIPIEIVMMLVLFPMALIEMAIMILAFPLAIILMACLEVIMNEGEIGFIKAFMKVWSIFWDAFRDIVNPDDVYPQNFPMLHSIGING